MFHIKRTEMISKIFRFPEDMLLELEILAQNNNVSMNNLVVQCCRYALDHLSPESTKTVDNHRTASVYSNKAINATAETEKMIENKNTEEAEE